MQQDSVEALKKDILNIKKVKFHIFSLLLITLLNDKRPS